MSSGPAAGQFSAPANIFRVAAGLFQPIRLETPGTIWVRRACTPRSGRNAAEL